MVTLAETTDLQRPHIPAEENDLSRRYLRIIEKWIPVGVEYFEDWPDRPNCGHFLGGCHWYGNETAPIAETFALTSVSPDYDESVVGVSREELQEMAVKGLRYLCFTHDTGPADCVRPSEGMGRPEICGTKWGQRGEGFFRESQCGHGISSLVRICLLLRDRIDDETWLMMANICADYADRFGEMDPKSGIYLDTQMEENAWTSNGLSSCYLFLERHEKAVVWETTCKRWMYSTCATPQDAKDQGLVGDSTARNYTGKIFTTLPDYWAENHGMVHPNYTGSGLRSILTVGCQLRLWGRELPAELFWNRRRVYESIKAMTDDAGYPLAVQGMDWHYLPTTGSEVAHAIASVFFDDSDAAALGRLGLRNTELRQEGNGGRMYDLDFAMKAHDQQDPMIMRETTIAAVTQIYKLHRLFGEGATPTPDSELDERLGGVREFSHSGFVHHRHRKGQTALSWRNSIMALPVTREGIYTISPCSDSWLGRPVVKDRPDSHRLRSARVTNYGDGFAAALVVDRCQESLRQQVLFASLPDGRALSFDRFVALEDLTLEGLDQGFLRVTNELFPKCGENCRGLRIIHTERGEKEFKGWLGDSEDEDVVERMEKLEWINIDDRIGIRFAGSGDSEYYNRHYYNPYRAIADDLILSKTSGARELRVGDEAGSLAAVVIPEQKHEDTPNSDLHIYEMDGGAAIATSGYLAAGNFKPDRRTLEIIMPDDAGTRVYKGTTVRSSDGFSTHSLALNGGSAVLLEEIAAIRHDGSFRIDVADDGTVFVTNVEGESQVAINREGKETTVKIGRGETKKID